MIPPHQLLVLSADTPAELEAAAERLRTELAQAPVSVIATRLRHQAGDARLRRFILCTSAADAITALDRPRRNNTMTAEVERPAPPVVFLFPGGGAQFAGMAADIYAASPVFREHVDRCVTLFGEHLGLDVRTAFDPDARLEDPPLGLAALFTAEYALAEFWQSLGVRPAAVIGHSLGEYSAAVVAGVLRLADAAVLVAVRARLLAGLPAGAMLGVELAEENVRSMLAGTELSIAAINAPKRCVVSGPAEHIAALGAELARQSIGARRLHISTAAHSGLVDSVLEEFGRAAAAIRPRPPRLPYISNVTGRWLSPDEASDPRYWQRHLRAPVRFADGLATILREVDTPVLLEVGPGTSLAGLVQQNDPAASLISSLRHPLDARTDAAALVRAVGDLWLAGVPIGWKSVQTGTAEVGTGDGRR
jgi:phthiocerol/phenolphthiocerol synthesis type-I polyketide synthase E